MSKLIVKQSYSHSCSSVDNDYCTWLHVHVCQPVGIERWVCGPLKKGKVESVRIIIVGRVPV